MVLTTGVLANRVRPSQRGSARTIGPEDIPAFKWKLVSSLAHNSSFTTLVFAAYVFLIYPPAEFAPPTSPFQTPFEKWKKPILDYEWDHAGTFRKRTDVNMVAEQIKEMTTQPKRSGPLQPRPVLFPHLRNPIRYFLRELLGDWGAFCRPWNVVAKALNVSAAWSSL
jgi:hypothetical protein